MLKYIFFNTYTFVKGLDSEIRFRIQLKRPVTEQRSYVMVDNRSLLRRCSNEREKNAIKSSSNDLFSLFFFFTVKRYINTLVFRAVVIRDRTWFLFWKYWRVSLPTRIGFLCLCHPSFFSFLYFGHMFTFPLFWFIPYFSFFFCLFLYLLYLLPLSFLMHFYIFSSLFTFSPFRYVQGLPTV